jgi:hypothetical protein
MKANKLFFFEKKNQKTFALLGALLPHRRAEERSEIRPLPDNGLTASC